MSILRKSRKKQHSEDGRKLTELNITSAKGFIFFRYEKESQWNMKPFYMDIEKQSIFVKSCFDDKKKKKSTLYHLQSFEDKLFCFSLCNSEKDEWKKSDVPFFSVKRFSVRIIVKLLIFYKCPFFLLLLISSTVPLFLFHPLLF